VSSLYLHLRAPNGCKMRDRMWISSAGVKVVLVQHYFLVALLF
jgi:hypothetical protein